MCLSDINLPQNKTAVTSDFAFKFILPSIETCFPNTLHVQTIRPFNDFTFSLILRVICPEFSPYKTIMLSELTDNCLLQPQSVSGDFQLHLISYHDN